MYQFVEDFIDSFLPPRRLQQLMIMRKIRSGALDLDSPEARSLEVFSFLLFFFLSLF